MLGFICGSFTTGALKQADGIATDSAVGYAALCGLVMWSFLQLVLGSYLGSASRTIFALLGALVFSAYIVLDTENLIAR